MNKEYTNFQWCLRTEFLVYAIIKRKLSLCLQTQLPLYIYIYIYIYIFKDWMKSSYAEKFIC